MVDAMTKNTIVRGLRDYTAGTHPLFSHQADAMNDTADHLDRPLAKKGTKGKKHDGGSIKMAASTGKTWVELATAIASGQKALIISPRVRLNTQIAETYTEAAKLGMNANDIVIYDSTRPEENKARAGEAKILVTTAAGFRALHRKGIISGDPKQPGYRPLVLLDESDTLIGPVTGTLLKQYYVPHCVTLGFSATDTGVSETLFSGQPRIHELTNYDAVKRGHIVRGIHAAALEVQPQSFNAADYLGARGEDYSEELLDKFARDDGVINATLNLHADYVDQDDPKHGKIGIGRIRDYPTLITTPRIQTAGYIADKFNQRFGKDYAVAVSGDTPQHDTIDPITGTHADGLDTLLAKFNSGQKPRVIVFPKVIDRGVNIDNATVMISLRPHKNKDAVEQYLGRVTRRGDADYAQRRGHDKIALAVNVYTPEMKPVLFTQLIRGAMLYSSANPPQRLPGVPEPVPSSAEPKPRPDFGPGVKAITEVDDVETLYRDAELARMEREGIVPPGWVTIAQAAAATGIDVAKLEERTRRIAPGEQYTVWGVKAGTNGVPADLPQVPGKALVFNMRGQRLLNAEMVDNWAAIQQRIEAQHGKGAGTAVDVARASGVSLAAVRSTQAFVLSGPPNVRALEQLAIKQPRKGRAD